MSQTQDRVGVLPDRRECVTGVVINTRSVGFTGDTGAKGLRGLLQAIRSDQRNALLVVGFGGLGLQLSDLADLTGRLIRVIEGVVDLSKRLPGADELWIEIDRIEIERCPMLSETAAAPLAR